MNDQEALRLLAEVVENVKKVTEGHKPRFYKIYERFAVSRVDNISALITNKNLRMCYFYFLMLNAILEARYNYILQNRIKDQLKTSAKLPEELKEIALYASSKVTIHVLSDEEGREVVDIEILRNDLESVFKKLDESTITILFYNVLSAIRMVYDEFVEEGYREMMEFYDNILKNCKKGWQEVYNTCIEYMLKMDKEAIMWLRRRGE